MSARGSDADDDVRSLVLRIVEVEVLAGAALGDELSAHIGYGDVHAALRGAPLRLINDEGRCRRSHGAGGGVWRIE